MGFLQTRVISLLLPVQTVLCKPSCANRTSERPRRCPLQATKASLSSLPCKARVACPRSQSRSSPLKLGTVKLGTVYSFWLSRTALQLYNDAKTIYCPQFPPISPSYRQKKAPLGAGLVSREGHQICNAQYGVSRRPGMCPPSHFRGFFPNSCDGRHILPESRRRPRRVRPAPRRRPRHRGVTVGYGRGGRRCGTVAGGAHEAGAVLAHGPG